MAETRPCPQCGKKMITRKFRDARWWSHQFSAYWWCGCGCTQSDEMFRQPTESEDAMTRWEQANV